MFVWYVMPQLDLCPGPHWLVRLPALGAPSLAPTSECIATAPPQRAWPVPGLSPPGPAPAAGKDAGEGRELELPGSGCLGQPRACKDTTLARVS